MAQSIAGRSELSPKSGFRRLFRGRNLFILYAMTPAVIFYVVMWIFPVGYGMAMSTTDWNPMSIHAPSFLGLDNFRRASTTPIVGIALRNSATYAVFTVGVGMILALGVALMLNSLPRGRGVFRFIFFLPVVTSIVAVGIIWKFLYLPRNGLFNTMLVAIRSFLGLSFPLPRYLMDPNLALLCIGVMSIWKGLGFTTVIFMAGLSGIPPEYYEAARVDGAGRLALFRHITIPMLQPTIVFTLVTGIAGAMQVFTEMYVMTGSSGGSGGATMGGPVNSTLTIVLELYQRAFRIYEFGYASALAVIVFVIISALSVTQLWIGRMRWEY